MTKILKFFYAMIILLSLFLAAIDADVVNCTSVLQCFTTYCYLHGTMLCLNGQCLCV
ncbi:Nodule Cysteine-Rich (NCR) secreted peptide [Medicago truncatula]|uniref:Nodule Cysteine-Rich (NCR) secreted peptide n=2 Tax=Medicago truncatula TaxID=3880 RepID=A0A072V566_MEDTR|nr:Nodule Cysteine-Rich (NCR) secreted peptide [Medicago truncatula]